MISKIKRNFDSEYESVNIILILTAFSLLCKSFEVFTFHTIGFDFSFITILKGFIFDISYTTGLSFFLLITSYLLFFWNKKVLLISFIILVNILLFVHFGLIDFYNNSGFLLDNQLFQYNIKEIIYIIEASKTDTYTYYLIPASIIFFDIIIYFTLKNKKPVKHYNALKLAFPIVSLLSFFAYSNALKNETFIEKDWTISKEYFFIDKTIKGLSDNADKNSIVSKSDILQYQSYFPDKQFLGTSYPLLYKKGNESTLSDFFQTSTTKPDIYIIFFEGLSSMISGKNATMGSFTPFLDSLASQGLYWPNCLTTSDHTFGVLPAIVGSLPNNRNGFTEHYFALPKHITLSSILKKNGYECSFFYGGWADFNGMSNFLDYNCRFNYIKKWKINDQFTQDKKSFNWGHTDKDVFESSKFYIDSLSSSPQLNLYMTLASHKPFELPENESKYYILKTKKHIENFKKCPPYCIKHIKELKSFLYTDDKIRELFYYLKKTGKLEHSIIIITGDHLYNFRLAKSNLDFFHSRLIIYSPLLKAHKTFPAVVSHDNIMPTLTALLLKNYKLKTPKYEHCINNQLDTSSKFRNINTLVLIDNSKNQKYTIDGLHYLNNDGDLFIFDSILQCKKTKDNVIFKNLQNKNSIIQNVRRYACKQNRLLPDSLYSEWNNKEIFFNKNIIAKTIKYEYNSLSDSAIIIREKSTQILLFYEELSDKLNKKDILNPFLIIELYRGKNRYYYNTVEFDTNHKSGYNFISCILDCNILGIEKEDKIQVTLFTDKFYKINYSKLELSYNK